MISLNKKIEEKIKIIIYFLLIISAFNIILTFYQKSILDHPTTVSPSIAMTMHDYEDTQ